MEINRKKLENILEKAEVIYLATSKKDVVSARPISPLNIGLRLFIRTSISSRKAKEMIINPNVAVCVGTFYFTGKATLLGSVFEQKNAKIKEAYQARYPDSFHKEDEFIKTDEVFFELIIEKVSEWVYEDKNPIGFAEEEL